MSMADNARKRPDDFLSDAFTPKAKDPANDPLAELARLIGQGDPFADAGRPGARKPLEGFRADDRPAPEWLARPAPSHDRDEAYDEPQPARHDHHAADQYDDGAAYQEPAAHDYRAQSAAAHDDRHGGRHERAFEEPQAAYQAEPAGYDNAQYQTESYQGDDRYRVAPPTPGDYEPDSYYADDGHMPPQSEEATSGGRRRGGLLTIAAVLGLAVIGTAGAFGYRAFTTNSGTSASPPVIKADTTPAKIVPPVANADAQGKPFQDRIGAAPAPERVVSREETPVSLPVPPRAGAAQPPAQGAAALAPARTSPVMAPPPAMPVAAGNEPKRVRTVTIRPDGTDGSETTATASPQQSAPAAAPTSTRSVAPKQQQAAPSQSGPMAIAPQSEGRTKTASRTNSAPPSANAGGAYVVQVSAQKTEAEAQSSYRALQTKYPSVLGGREPIIRRAELGQSGTWYRVHVGSFQTSEQASAFCSNLKNAGGQCIVQRN